MDTVAKRFRAGNARELGKIAYRFHPLFRRIGMFKDEITDLENELRVRRESGGLSHAAVVWMGRINDGLEGVVHHLKDVVSFGSDLMRSGALTGEWKEKLGAEMGFLAAKMREIVATIEEAGKDVPAVKDLDDAGEPRCTEPDMGKGKEQLQQAALKISFRHLRSELAELTRFVRVFLEK